MLSQRAQQLDNIDIQFHVVCLLFYERILYKIGLVFYELLLNTF